MTSKEAVNKQAVFTTGSTMRHVVVMTATASIGLVSLFFVDVLNLFYISLLGKQELTAAIGYAATIMFFSISVCIGSMIPAAALVGKALGAGKHEDAKRLATSSLIFLTLITVAFSIILYPALPWVLKLLGARGETFEQALTFMQIVVFSVPLLGLGMGLSALLRAVGDPKRAMFVTLAGGAAALFLDPLLIFGFDLGLKGAAIATVLVRVILVFTGFWGVLKVHKLLAPIQLSNNLSDAKAYFAIAVPAVATQMATPMGNAYVTQAISEFGDGAVAGWAVIGRVIPVAFGTIFALSGSIGPIFSQNFGALKFDRIQKVLRDALVFTLVYCLVVWGLLALLTPWIITTFSATGEAASLIQVFTLFVAGSYLFNGALFVANSAFNNLGYPLYATFFNWTRATLGVVPFVLAGKAYGAGGVLIGWGIGAVVFGIGGVIVAFWVTKKIRPPIQQAATATATASS